MLVKSLMALQKVAFSTDHKYYSSVPDFRLSQGSLLWSLNQMTDFKELSKGLSTSHTKLPKRSFADFHSKNKTIQNKRTKKHERKCSPLYYQCWFWLTWAWIPWWTNVFALPGSFWTHHSSGSCSIWERQGHKKTLMNQNDWVKDYIWSNMNFLMA